MRLPVLVLLLLSVALAQAQWWGRFKNNVREAARFPQQAIEGARDMRRAYLDMKEANHKYSDRYFHARGNYDAARRGRGGAFAARVISDVRELTDLIRFKGLADTKEDQRANKWGRSGRDPNHFRPSQLPDKY